MTGVPSERRKAPRATDPELRGRRSEPRAYLLLPASAEVLSGHRHVRVLDISRTGARLEGYGLPEVGKDVVLRCACVDAFGTIAWAEEGRCGVRFDEPLLLRDLVILRDLAMAIEQSDLSAEEMEAAADWSNGLAR